MRMGCESRERLIAGMTVVDDNVDIETIRVFKANLIYVIAFCKHRLANTTHVLLFSIRMLNKW